MQIGSLVTPKKDLDNHWFVKGESVPFYRPLKKGEILTVCLIIEGDDEEGKLVTGLCFEETGIEIHPCYNDAAAWYDMNFDELQPPISISDELFSHAPEKCEA